VRILLVGDYPDDPRLGSGKVYHKLREEFAALGHECDVLLAPDLGPRPANARLRWLVGPVLAERAVRRAFAGRGAYDVVDAASAEGEMIGIRRRAGGYPGVALVSRSHGLEHLNYRRMLDDSASGLLPKPWYRRLWLPADRIDLVPHGVSARFLDDAPPPDAPRGRGLLFCGTWDAVKGVDTLVRAMDILQSTNDAPTLTILGPGLPPDAVLAAFPAGVRPRLTIIPRAPEDEVMRHYREHDALVVPSTYEGFGMVIVEAMSQRLPVVSTPVGCAPALVRDGETGLLTPPRDADTLAAAIRRITGEGDARRRMGDAARDAVRGMSWTATARRTIAVYEAALARARRA
jgi:glycosyltransferase involved in cell wall biosynthesis